MVLSCGDVNFPLTHYTIRFTWNFFDDTTKWPLASWTIVVDIYHKVPHL